MIIRCLAQRPGALQPLVARASRRAPRCTRTYTVPTLQNHNDLQRHGISGLLSRKGFNTAYTVYQQHMIDELNASTDGTPYENQEPKSLVIEFARDPTKAYAFNIASMAFNNHFFFRGINVNPDVQSQPSQDLTAQIRKDFSSVDTLRESFLSTAEAMFGPGFVWLVQTNDSHIGSLRILPTYLAGSPLSGAHYRRQSHDLNTHNADSYQALNKVGSFGAAAKQNNQPKKPLGGIDVIPLLCVNTWEHVWLKDFGMLGKRKYLEAWWDKIDWGFVRDNATLISRNDQTPKQFEYE
ncbi:Fe superoxide dismutase-like protein [Paraphoma chrysanthemicola]|uniref:Fe superoxide dismutase-like protein n=1 Tax=Paraphoma chrysanthemicola TaxID=798071 RepID=A0A8K0QU91_9PLEO|nr:Fe superoxide dismutase-like protein [Paraphoma chrysanthemicola]